MRPRVQPECKEKIYTGATGTPAGVWKFQAQKKPPTTGDRELLGALLSTDHSIPYFQYRSCSY